MWKLAIIVISTLALQTSFIDCKLDLTHQYDPDCGRYFENTHTTRIAGGIDAAPGQFPSYVGVGSGNRLCGGVIITAEHVLTSAHCVIGNTEAEIFFRLSTRVPEPFRPFYSSKICVSKKAKITPGENFTAINDIAIIKMKEPLPFSKKTWSACLMDEQTVAQREVMYTVGFGEIAKGRKSDHLKYMGMLKTYCVDKDNHESIFCSRPSGSGGNTCFGDSGGGLYRFKENRQFVVGINSYTYKDCTDKEVGLPKHAHVYNLREEIKELMQECK